MIKTKSNIIYLITFGLLDLLIAIIIAFFIDVLLTRRVVDAGEHQVSNDNNGGSKGV